VPLPQVGAQALILCGPRASFESLLSPRKTPKCLALIASRPMIYYPLKFCEISHIDVTLITPPSTLAHIKSALQQNPHLQSLPLSKLLAAQDLEATVATAQLLRLLEVQSCIKSDFLLLPCDLAYVDGVSRSNCNGEGERHRRRELYLRPKDESLDLIAVEPLRQTRLSKLLMSVGMDTVKRNLERDKGFLLRQSFTKQQAAQNKILTGYCDTHLYIFLCWAKDLVQRQKKLVPVSEDLIGLWAKSSWQRGLPAKLRLSPKPKPALLLSTSLRLAIQASIEEIGHAQSPFAHDRKTTSFELGSGSYIDKGSVLRDCEVQEGNVVPEKTEAKNEKFMPLFEDLKEDTDNYGMFAESCYFF
ncbi:uncharacterized protein N7500_001076, partial [Penicillium coprophilum]|uniref:uncharacterized protein n=1 Tax=Penicillium coprophilum TaxID=36646 RepID=UPI00238FDAE3